jgi:predicted nucleotidyltransferase component of viral defense system
LDIQLIERTIFAFGLLEALVKTKLPFVFKGGTALMLLLDQPFRLSTDIDIIVNPECEMERYLRDVSVTVPFLRVDEHIRTGRNGIVKKHFKVYYLSPTSETEVPILLDVVFSNHGYENLTTKAIHNEFLLTSGEPHRVSLPTIESILGDKLTAFAPHTTGIDFEYVNHNGNKVEKTLEVIKQFLDVSQLIKEVRNPESVWFTYNRIAVQEIEYRGIPVHPNDCLLDTFQAALSIVSRGGLFAEDYRYLIKGIRKIQNHVFGLDINGEVAYQFAAPVLLFVAKMITRRFDIEITRQPPFDQRSLRSINQIRRLDPNTFDIVATAIKMVGTDHVLS